MDKKNRAGKPRDTVGLRRMCAGKGACGTTERDQTHLGGTGDEAAGEHGCAREGAGEDTGNVPTHRAHTRANPPMRVSDAEDKQEQAQREIKTGAEKYLSCVLSTTLGISQEFDGGKGHEYVRSD